MWPKINGNGGLKFNQARRLKELEQENARLRRAVSDLTLDKLISKEAAEGLSKLKNTAREGGNLFEVMMEIVEHCSVGQVTQALFESGGKFRRNM